MNNPRSGYLSILGAVLIWSGWMVSTRFLALGPLSPLDITALRFGIAGAVLLPVVYRRGLFVGPYGIWSSLLLSILLGAAYIAVVATGMRFAPASHGASIINGGMVSTSVMLGILWLKEPFPVRKQLGVFVLLIGMALIVYSRLGGDANIGHLFFALGGMMWGLYGILLRRWGVSAWHATAVVSVLSAVYYLPIYFAFVPSMIPTAPWSLILFHGFYQGILTSIVALYWYGHAVQTLGASTTSAFVPLVPILTLLLGIPTLKEIPNQMEIAAVALVFGGLFLVLSSRTAKRRIN